jgi:hypothetical protein
VSGTRALLPAVLFSLGLAVSLTWGCGSIDVTKPDGAAGSSAGGTTGSGGAAGTGGAGTTGSGGAAGSGVSRGGAGGTAAAGRGGSDGSGTGGGGQPGGAGGNTGNAGRGGATGAAGRGGTAGGAAGRGGAGGAAGSSAGRGGNGGTAAGGRGGTAGTGAAGRGGTGGGGGGPCACQAIYQPVCGVDGMTYANSCEAMCVGVTVAHTGACAAECQSNADCVHYPEYVGTCCGACLPKTAPMPEMISCAKRCDTPITCPCVVGKCVETPVGGTTQ